MKILIVGATGFLGNYIVNIASPTGHDVVATYLFKDVKPPSSNVKYVMLDKTNTEMISKVFYECSPDVIIDASLIGQVDFIEKNMFRTRAVNVYGTFDLIKKADEIGSKFIFVSTDFVFDGFKGGEYIETDVTSPLNEYGSQKVVVENYLSKMYSKYNIVRTSVLYGWNSINDVPVPREYFITKLLATLKRGEVFKAITGQYEKPTYAKSVAEQIVKLCEEPINGIFHVAGATCTDRYGHARATAKVYGFSEKLVVPCSANDFTFTAKRPVSTCLNTEKAEKFLNYKPLTLEEGLDLMRIEKDAQI